MRKSTILINGTFKPIDQRQPLLSCHCLPPVGVKGARFLLCLRWLIQKCLWQVDESVSYGHLWLYPTCQLGMNCPSHQRSPLISLAETVEKHEAEDSGEGAASNAALGAKKRHSHCQPLVDLSPSELLTLPSHFTRGVYVIRSLMRLSHDTTIIEHLDRASARVSRAVIKTIC